MIEKTRLLHILQTTGWKVRNTWLRRQRIRWWRRLGISISLQETSWEDRENNEWEENEYNEWEEKEYNEWEEREHNEWEDKECNEWEDKEYNDKKVQKSAFCRSVNRQLENFLTFKTSFN